MHAYIYIYIYTYMHTCKYIWGKKYMKIDFSKVVFIDEFQVTFEGSDGWVNRWILSNSNAPVAKIRQQGGNSVMIWTGIFNQAIIGSLNINEGAKLNSINNCDFMNKTFFVQVSVS